MQTKPAMAEAIIDRAALVHNISLVRDRVGPNVKILFPVKANAYGHGAAEIARVAERAGVDYLGVANLAEAIELREAKIARPILILSASRAEHIPRLVESDVTVTVSIPTFAAALNREAAGRGKHVKVHVKVDTGMGRNGALPDEVVPLLQTMQGLKHLDVEGIFSHFACAYSSDLEDQRYTRSQIRVFSELLSDLERQGLLPRLRHIANSAGLLQYETEVTTGLYNLVRPGILLYGYLEVEREWARAIKAILRVRTWITSIKELPAGRHIGYGRHYRTEASERVATIPMGYADGLIWLLANRGEVVVRGRSAPIVGGISMDQTTALVTHIPEAQVGDEVTVIGPQMPAPEVARRIGAHFTEVVLTSLSQRVARVYT